MTTQEEQEILKTLTEKSLLKQKVFEITKKVFDDLKAVLQEVEAEYNNHLRKVDRRIMIQYRDRSEFEAEIKVAGDVLIFSMHTNVFEFYRAHNVWKTSYLQSNKEGSYSGIINIYNFLADSFKYNRLGDLGYLIGRVFINKDKHYFVEGKRELGFMYNHFGAEVITQESIRKIINSSILYSLNFDLLVPPYDEAKIVTVAQMKEQINNERIKTGKRLGFKFYADEN